MSRSILVIHIGRCVMRIDTDLFFDRSTITNIRKLFRCIYQETDRNMDVIEYLSGYLPVKVATGKNAKECEKYQKALTNFEQLKTKYHIKSNQ